MGSKKLLFAVVLLCASASAQNFLVPVPPVFLGPAVAPRLGAGLTISFCNSTATLNSCLAGSAYAQAYADSTNSNPINQTTTPLKTDALGNAPAFFAAPGQYSFTVSGPGITAPQGPYQIAVQCAGACTFSSATITGALTASGATTLGNGNSFSTVTFSNHNAMFWAGPGATPTIDQAVTACASNPCVVTISPTYSGPESTNLFTTSLGYKVYNGANNVTIHDLRANAAAIPANAPIYGVIYGGRLAGQLNREGVSYYAGSPADSSTGITSFNWFTGTAPSNNGLQAGSINALIMHDAITIGSSTSEFTGTDSEMHMDATSADNPVNQAYSYGGAVLASRANANQNALNTAVFRAKQCNNIGTGVFYYCYGFTGDVQSGGAYRNFSYHSRGDFLLENAVKLWAVDVGASATIANSPTGATESGQTVTITTTAPCSLVAGQEVAIAGVGVAGYNGGGFTVLAPGCNGGSTFTYYNPGTSGLAASGGGTATGGTPRVVTTYAGTNTITYQPMADAQGWQWQSQGGSQWLLINSTGLTSKLAHFFTGTAGSATAGQAFLGGAGSEWAGLYLFETGAPSPRAGDTVCGAVSATHTLQCSFNNGTPFSMAQVIAATSAAFATATTAGTCVQNVTAVTGAATTMAVSVSPVSTPGVGAQWSAFVSSAGNVTINECAVATSAGGTIAFNIRVFP